MQSEKIVFYNNNLNQKYGFPFFFLTVAMAISPSVLNGHTKNNFSSTLCWLFLVLTVASVLCVWFLIIRQGLTYIGSPVVLYTQNNNVTKSRELNDTKKEPLFSYYYFFFYKRGQKNWARELQKMVPYEERKETKKRSFSFFLVIFLLFLKRIIFVELRHLCETFSKRNINLYCI